jgi:hypothetical protein
VSNASLLIGAAVFMLAFGVLVTVVERTRHPPATPVITFTGLAGVYPGLCATVEHVRGLYLPCIVLLLMSRRSSFAPPGDPAATTTDEPEGRPSLTQKGQSIRG